MMFFHTGLYLPPSLFNDGFRTIMKIDSFTPLSNQRFHSEGFSVVQHDGVVGIITLCVLGDLESGRT